MEKIKIGIDVIWLLLFLILCIIAMFLSLNKTEHINSNQLASETSHSEVNVIEMKNLKLREVTNIISHCAPPTHKEDVEIIAKTVWGEARGLSKKEQAAVIWCILNRVDNKDFPNDIISVITQKNQFTGYLESNPVEEDIVSLVYDVLGRWELEKIAIGDVGRVIPKEYCWFYGNGKENLFRDKYKGGQIWRWTLDSPYKVG